MKIKCLTDKGSGIVNEDSHLITPNLFGVFDGAKGLVEYRDEKGNTGGLIASQIAREVFEKNKDKPLIESISEAIGKIKEKMIAAKINMADKTHLWDTKASVVRIKEDSIEYLKIGDCPIVFVDKNGKIQTFFKDHDLDSLLLWKKLADKGVRNIRNDKRMQDQFAKIRRLTNISYGVLNGEEEALNFIEKGRIRKENVKNILIFSDGMLIPKKDPRDPEDFETIVKLFNEGGLEKVKKYVRQIEDSDPDCLKYPRFKKYDDLTAIAITL